MPIKFRNSIDVSIPPAAVRRLATYFQTITESAGLTDHWKVRETDKTRSFEFVGDSRLVYRQQENGLDDYYPANFGYGPILTLPSLLKRRLLRRWRRPDPLSLDPILNYELSAYRHGDLSLGSLEQLDSRNPNWAAVRAVLIANMLIPHLDAAVGEPRVILEIGPGSGNLLYCLKKRYPRASCVFVDLPSSLPFSFANVLSKKPDATFMLPHEVASGPHFEAVDFVFLRNDQVNLIPDRSVDVALNTVSFAEMSREQIDRYFSELRRVCQSANVFYCLNRVEKQMVVDGRQETIRFHEYPWLGCDKDIFFRLSEIETPVTTRSAMFERLSVLCVSGAGSNAPS